ncbi:MAG: amidohydrolase family protein [Pseudomonadota bacterium]
MKSCAIGLSLCFAAIGCALTPQAAYGEEAGERIVFAGQFVDVRGGVMRENVGIRIKDGVIESVEDAVMSEIAGDYIDLSGYTVLPGLIDVHTHLCDNSFMGPAFDHWTYPAATFGIVGAVNARKTLRAGFTTVRDVSAPFYADIALRDAIEAGWIEGPSVLASGAMITMSGGHGSWGNWIGPQHTVTTEAHVNADGADEVRKAVRVHVRNNVDLIKVVATGGFGTANSMPGAATYSVDELRAAVEEARKHGLKVAAHAHGAEGVLNAVNAGVDSVEHGSMIDEEGIKAMRRAGTYLVMDLLAARFDLIEKNEDYADKGLDGDNAAVFEAYLDLFRQAYDAGVPMAFGTDAGIYPHGRNAEQFALMVRAGMSNADALRSATIWAADLLGMSDRIGEISAGRKADLIAVSGNPLADAAVLEDVEFVMKDGRVIVTPAL